MRKPITADKQSPLKGMQMIETIYYGGRIMWLAMDLQVNPTRRLLGYALALNIPLPCYSGNGCAHIVSFPCWFATSSQQDAPAQEPRVADWPAMDTLGRDCCEAPAVARHEQCADRPRSSGRRFADMPP